MPSGRDVDGHLRCAVDLLAAADALVIAAGAGMGVDSGLPDFRGREGFWRAYPALGRAGLDFTTIACPDAFRADPALAWGFYGHRLALYRRTVPHPGFAILQRWAAGKPGGASVFTSNVDGQFQRAGFAGEDVHECHGSIHYLQCLAPCGDRIWSAAGFEPVVDEAACRLVGEPPRCPDCGGLARPNVLMFGDGRWLPQRSDRQAMAQEAWLARVRRPVVLELGAGTAIPSVRHFAERVARRWGGGLVRINLREPEVAAGLGIGLALGAQAALAALDELLAGDHPC